MKNIALIRFFDAKLRATFEDRGAATKPQWQKLFPLGTYHRTDFPGGAITFDNEFFTTMMKNWENAGSPELPLDYFHRGESDSSSVPNESKVASGWFSDFAIKDDGFYGLTKWTDKARAHILADELRYLSPTFATNARDRKTGKNQGPTLFGAALLNDPFLTDLPRVAASAVEVLPANQTTALAGTEKKMKKQILAALAAAGYNFADDATDEALVEAVNECAAAKANVAKLTADKEAAVKLSGGLEPLKLQVTALASKVDSLEAEKVKLEAAAKTAGIDALCLKLAKKVRPAGMDAVKKFASTQGVEAAAEFFGAFPDFVTTGEAGTGAGTADSPETAFKKLQAMSDDLVKAGVSRSEAMIRAISANPELAKLSETMASPKRN